MPAVAMAPGDATLVREPLRSHWCGHDPDRVIWKIDAYDLSLGGHSPDPADPAVSVRVLTIMLAEVD